MEEKGPHPDQQFITGIRNKDSDKIRMIYQDFYPMILSLVTKNSGTDTDAEDIMQRVLISIYERLYKDLDFRLSSKFSTFLYSVAINLWLKELRKKKPESLITNVSEMELMDDLLVEIDFEEEDLATKRHLLFWGSFERLGDDCKKLLRQFFKKKESKDIASSFSISYDGYRVKKTRCIKKLTSYIEDHPDYNELRGD